MEAIDGKESTLKADGISWRGAIQLVVPKDHGSWSLALEPVAFGLLVAPSAAGAALAVAAVSGFFLRLPLKVLLSGKGDSRQALAALESALLFAAGQTGLLVAVLLGVPGGWWPLIPAAMAGAVFAWCDNRNKSRESHAELAGSMAFGLLPAAMGSLAGWGAGASLALAGAMLARSIPTVMTLRTSIRIRKGRPHAIGPALLASGAGVVAVSCLNFLHLAPLIAMIFAFLLATRSAWLLLWRPQIPARSMGILEAAAGIVMVLALGFSWPVHYAN